MASVTSFLPKLFRWVFMVLGVLATLGAAVALLAIIINPHVPAGIHFGPTSFDFLGQPASAVLRPSNGDSDFTLTLLRGMITLFVAKAGGLIETVKHHALPVLLLHLIFLAVLFDLLRRLFRNVGRGDTFTLQSVRLVQYLAGTLIVFSFVYAFAEHWFAQSVFAYLAQHTQVMVSGTELHLPPPRGHMFPHGIPIDGPPFFAGLLVLALSEVFRQGLALKTENDLTV